MKVSDADLAKRLAVYIAPVVARMLDLDALRDAVSGGGTGSVHDIGGPFHSGALRDEQGPQFLLRNGTRSLTGDMAVAAGVRIDGVDLDVHASNANAHHARTHAITGGDHTATGAQYSVVGLSATNALGILPTTSNGFSNANTILRSTSDYGLQLSYLRAETIKSLGDLVLDPGGDDVLPRGHAQIDLGDWARSFRTLFVKEIYAQTLVAQDVLSTIGGRILVAPTTKLTTAINATATTIATEHNNLLPADFAYMEASPNGISQVEWMLILTNPVKVGDEYRYLVSRNVDGTGANSWLEGDAVVNMGGNPLRGAGTIELTSTQTILQQLGPTITINERIGSIYHDDIRTTVVLGNLESFADYAEKTMGLVIGKDATLTPAGGFVGITADYTNGVRTFSLQSSAYNVTTPTYLLEPHGDLLIGSNLANIANTSWAIFSKARTYGGESIGAGDMILGNKSGSNIFWDASAGQFKFRQGTTTKAYVDADGSINAGGGNWLIDADGQNMQQDSPVTPDAARAIKWWDNISSRGGNPSQAISAFYNTLNEQVLEMEARATGSIFTSHVLLTAIPYTGSQIGLAVNSSGTVDVKRAAAARAQIRPLASTNDVYLPALNLGNNVRGSGIYLGRNTNAGAAGPAPAWIAMMSPNGTWNYLWFDNSGNLRKATADPTGSTGSATRNALTYGTVIG